MANIGRIFHGSQFAEANQVFQNLIKLGVKPVRERYGKHGTILKIDQKHKRKLPTCPIHKDKYFPLSKDSGFSVYPITTTKHT